MFFEIAHFGSADRFEASSHVEALEIAKKHFDFITSDKQEAEFLTTGSAAKFSFCRKARRAVVVASLRDITERVKWQDQHDSYVGFKARCAVMGTSGVGSYLDKALAGDHCLHVAHAMVRIKDFSPEWIKD